MSAGGEHLKDEGTRRQVVLAGGIAGLISRFCIAPLDVVKIRLQLQIHSLSDPASHANVTGPVYKGTLSTIKTILREEGLPGLWKGNIPAELMYVCYGAIQFTTYRSTTQLLAQLDPHRLPQPVESFAAGAVAGGVATASTYPLDLLRTRFAAQGSGEHRVYTSLFSSVKDIAKSEGPAGFFRGCSAAVGQIVPYMGLFFATYEALRPGMSCAPDFLPVPLLPGSGDAAAGMVASVLAKTGVFPLDLVRKRLQVQGPTRSLYVHRNIPEYQGVFNTLALTFRTQGMRGLYRGLTVSLFKAAPASAVTMWTYERALKLLKEHELAADNVLDCTT
ncbi:mitochondrial carrier domain-containing protein [Aspergillus egyptiacus]|nr:mitochondrial carrier domain-containing protein [Aspergillus egyptiacus]